jgi:nucleotide-binding universal stress UspA family protein
MYRRILMPLDGSALAEQVLPLAKMFAARFQAAVVLFQAIPTVREPLRAEGEVFPADEQMELMRWQAREYLLKISKDFAVDQITTTCEVRVGAPAPAMLEFAEGAGIDLIAMTTHGRTGLLRWVYGSIADKVLHGAHVPLLLLRAREEPVAPKPLTRLLVPLDGSALAEEALAPARQIAAAFGAEVLLLRVWGVPAVGYDNLPVPVFDELEQAARAIAQSYVALVSSQLQAQGVRVTGETQSGAAAEGILEMVQRAEASLIVMSTHGRSGLSRWVMGIVAESVLRAAPVPVLLIRAAHASV